MRISVADDGPGISPDRIDELFEPFNRLVAESSEIEGTRIGLLISRQLVELMHGQLTADSSPGEGSPFSICLGAHGTGAADNGLPRLDPGSARYPANEPPLAVPRILVAEDNEVNRKLIAAQLEYLGYCTMLESACEAHRDVEIADCLLHLQQAAEAVEAFVACLCEEAGTAAKGSAGPRSAGPL